MCAVRDIERVCIHSRNRGSVDQLIEEMSADCACTLVGAGSAAEAIAQSDIVCTVSTSAQPLFEDSELPDGVHLNVVGRERTGTGRLSKLNDRR